MSNYATKLSNLQDRGLNEVFDIIRKQGVESKHCTDQCLKITDDNYMFNLDGGRYLTEITEEKLIDDKGYSYNHSVLDVDDLIGLIDHLIEANSDPLARRSIDVLHHEIEFFLKDEDGKLRGEELLETDSDHIEESIIKGMREGELNCYVWLNDQPITCTGWWKINN